MVSVTREWNVSILRMHSQSMLYSRASLLFCRHGKGKASFTNGDCYEGMYEYDQRNGVGTYKWADGRVYTGGFVNDMREGTCNERSCWLVY